MNINQEKEKILDVVKDGKNVVIMGSGGTGKTFLIQRIREWADGNGLNVGVTAMTGKAAIIVKGSTIHSYAGIGILDNTPEHYIYKLKRSKPGGAGERIRMADILIIDEFSMMSEFFLNFLYKVISEVRGGKKLQWIFCGDPKQLPPVHTSYEKDITKKRPCYESIMFQSMFGENIFVLKQNFRHRDPVYSRCLEEIGKGIFTPETKALLESRITEKNIMQDIPHLYGVNYKADMHNDYRYDMINEKEFVYMFHDTFTSDKENPNPIYARELIDKMKRLSRFQEDVRLKKGTYVVCMANVDVEGGWANGTAGVVVGFFDKDCNRDVNKTAFTFPIVCKDKEKAIKYMKGEIPPITRKVEAIGDFRIFDGYDVCDMIEEKVGTVTRVGVPLAFGWAITIHKSQGSEFDELYVFSDDIWCEGQAYVALSRVKTLQGLKLSSVPKIVSSKTAIDFIEKYS